MVAWKDYSVFCIVTPIWNIKLCKKLTRFCHKFAIFNRSQILHRFSIKLPQFCHKLFSTSTYLTYGDYCTVGWKFDHIEPSLTHFRHCTNIKFMPKSIIMTSLQMWSVWHDVDTFATRIWLQNFSKGLETQGYV